MKENNEMQLMIEVLSGDNNDTAAIATELARKLGKSAKVQLTTTQPPMIPTRGGDAGLMLEVIGVTLAGFETLILLAMLLKDIHKKKTGSILILSNPETGEKAKLLETDSLKKIEKKIRKVFRKENVKVLSKKE